MGTIEEKASRFSDLTSLKSGAPHSTHTRFVDRIRSCVVFSAAVAMEKIVQPKLVKYVEMDSILDNLC